MTMRGSSGVYRASIQGMFAVYTHFFNSTNTLHHFPSPNLFPCTENMPMCHSQPPTAHLPVPHMFQTVEHAHKTMFQCSHHLLPTRQRMQPGGRILCVWYVPLPFPPPPTTQTQRTLLWWQRSLCLGCFLQLLPPRHEEHDYRVAFFMSGWQEGPSHHLLPPFPPLSPLPLISNTRTSPHRLILVFRYVPSSLSCLEHHNVPMWACSGAQAPLLSVSLSLSSFPVSNISSSHTISGIYLFSQFLYQDSFLFCM